MASAGDAGCGGGVSRWVQSSPLATLAQVGAVCEGVRQGGELDNVSACWLEPPATPWGEAGGQGWGSITWSKLARLDS
jgi:hypothetical protein